MKTKASTAHKRTERPPSPTILLSIVPLLFLLVGLVTLFWFFKKQRGSLFSAGTYVPKKITGTIPDRHIQSTDNDLEIQYVRQRKTPALFRALSLFNRH